MVLFSLFICDLNIFLFVNILNLLHFLDNDRSDCQRSFGQKGPNQVQSDRQNWGPQEVDRCADWYKVSNFLICGMARNM